MPESRASTSLSESFAPSMRVEEPMLSMVAMRRRDVRRSGRDPPERGPYALEFVDLRDQPEDLGCDREGVGADAIHLFIHFSSVR
jgi:hypothetical protein